ncbi:aminodeoxychorismate synthase, component I [Geminicoccaceae bacterium 1502E]|nr:aminodeoxychorismate synthase, component I [Geminicoccaceae bacterium 1502E]
MDADLLTREIPFADPLAVYESLRHLPAPVLLESARADGRMGRWSYVAADPFVTLSSRNGRMSCEGATLAGDPFAALQRILAAHAVRHDPALPPFQTGAIGYLGYDLAHHLERLPSPERDDLAFPDLILGFYDTVVALDHVEQRGWLLSSGLPEKVPAARLTRRRQRLELFAGLVGQAAPLPPPVATGPVTIRSNFTRERYEAAVQRVVDYILAGDIFQANIAQRFLAELPDGLDAAGLYRRLRARNPAPFAALLDFGETAIASASPERFLSVADGVVETRPIKGTRPRGATPDEDERLAAELLASGKDRAENVMIVDLLRNDLSRVCREHSVRTPEVCVLESYATVHHLVSTVTGRLREGTGAVDLLRATFPGGSITGAPKIRAMEIIAELEPTARGPYCGSIGWIGFDGWMDTSITIRTYAIKGRTVTFQAGGGIVADSSPAAEYDETIDKARALIGALRDGA